LAYRNVSISIDETVVESADNVVARYPRKFASRSDLIEEAVFQFLERNFPSYLPEEEGENDEG